MCHYGMAVWGRGLHQELWYVVDGNFINSALHGAKKVVVKVGDLVIYYYDRPVTVSGYDPQLGYRDFKTVPALLEYTHPLTGQIYHIVIHQAI